MIVSMHPVSRLRPQSMHPVDRDLSASDRSRTLSMNPVGTSSFQYSPCHITAGCASHDAESFGMTYTDVLNSVITRTEHCRIPRGLDFDAETVKGMYVIRSTLTLSRSAHKHCRLD
jgi:hypothetical protein